MPELSRSFRYESSLLPVFPWRCVLPVWKGFRDRVDVTRKGFSSSSGALPMGQRGTNWELGFNQCRLHHGMQVLQVCDFCAFSSPPAFPPCYCPLYLSVSGKADDLWKNPPISILVSRNTALAIATQHTAIALRQGLFRLDSDLRYGFTPRFARRIFEVRSRC